MIRPDDVELKLTRGIYSVQIIVNPNDDSGNFLDEFAVLYSNLVKLERQDDSSRKQEEKARQLYDEHVRLTATFGEPWAALSMAKRAYWLGMAKRLAKCE